MKTVGNWVNYDYAPGLPSYGLPGMQGNAGKNGNCIFYTGFNIYNGEQYDIKEFCNAIRYNRLPIPNYINTSNLNRKFQIGDYFFDNRGNIFKLIIDPATYDFNLNITDYSDVLELCGKINTDSDNALLSKIDNNRVNINNDYTGMDIIINNTNYTIDNENLYNIRVMSDTADNNGIINFQRFTAITPDGINNNMDILYDSTIDAFKIKSNKPIILDGDITVRNTNKTLGIDPTVYGYSRVATSDNNINNFYNICQQLRAVTGSEYNNITIGNGTLAIFINNADNNITKLYNDIYSALNISITFLVDGKKYNRITPLNTFKPESYAAYTKDFISDFLSQEQLNLIQADHTKLKVLTVTCIYNIEVYLKLINE